MSVTLRQLRAFIAVAELGHFNLAANRMNLTQSATSVLIKTLETEVGQKLFNRHTRMVELTVAGQEFLPHARQVIEDLERAVGNLHDHALLRRGEVTVAAAIVLASTWLPPIIAEFLDRHPDITVRIRDMPEEEIRASLKNNSVDLAIGTVNDSDPEITSTALMSDRLMVFCNSEHRFASQTQVCWKDLATERLIVLAKENPLRDLVERALKITAPNLVPSYEIRFSSTAISMIASNLGVSVLPENARLLSPKVQVVAVDLVDPVAMRRVSLFQHRHRSLSTAAMKMKDAILKHRA